MYMDFHGLLIKCLAEEPISQVRDEWLTPNNAGINIIIPLMVYASIMMVRKETGVPHHQIWPNAY